jgi:hypothetical protein
LCGSVWRGGRRPQLPGGAAGQLATAIESAIRSLSGLSQRMRRAYEMKTAV